MDLSKQQPSTPQDLMLENVFDAQDYLIINKHIDYLIEPQYRNTVDYIDNRIIAKLNIKLADETFVKVPFIIDINYPGELSLCPMACRVLSARLEMDTDGVKYIETGDEIDYIHNGYGPGQSVCNKKILFELNNGNANYIGVKFLQKMEISIDFNKHGVSILLLDDYMLYI